MKFENIRVFNFGGAFRGMRNPKNSWHLSDSYFGLADLTSPRWEFILDKIVSNWTEENNENENEISEWLYSNAICYLQDDDLAEVALIGPKDLRLAQTLIRGGSEHRKFLRQIFLTVDITAPLYWFKEFDTYKVGTVANSTSTMHKIDSKPISLEDFEIDDFSNLILTKGDAAINLKERTLLFIDILEHLRKRFKETGDKKYWKELIRWLPESYLQTRTVTMNYENLLSIYHQRKNHKLNEWSGKDDCTKDNFIAFIKQLPYAEELILYADAKSENN